MNTFLQDTLAGLRSAPKYLQSKYFYNETGDAIFRDIMASPDYYLTNCELDIFTHQSEAIIDAVNAHLSHYDVIELGPGDCYKSVHLLRALMQRGMDFTYYPIDISRNVISGLDTSLRQQLPGIKMHGLNGDYLQMLEEIAPTNTPVKSIRKNKLVLFLGSSVGNFPAEETVGFFKQLREHLLPGDVVLTGFDLKKDPAIILKAYNDEAGVTRKFNLNLLNRINDELGADFDLQLFEHKPVYDEVTGACKSYLESTRDQLVAIGPGEKIDFRQGEKVYMEISQKYTVAETDDIANAAGFVTAAHFADSKKWFLDALWIR